MTSTLFNVDDELISSDEAGVLGKVFKKVQYSKARLAKHLLG